MLLSEPDKKRPRLRLRLRPAGETAVRSGHPWVFDKSIKEQNRAGDSGELAVIYDRNNRFLAIGLFDPDSPIRVRVLHTGDPVTISGEWWSARLSKSIELRHGLFDDQTTGRRLVNGESDGWPGLVLDQYGNVLVLKLYSAVWLPMIEDLKAMIMAQFPDSALILRLSRNIQAAAKAVHRFDGETLLGALDSDTVVFEESGIRFLSEFRRGQKTGFFLDQRQNRRKVETLSAGASVLNAFSFSGGFSLYAARGGAVQVTDVDISAHALEAARANFTLNAGDKQIASCKHEGIQADVFDWLVTSERRSFDLVILDPPSLAKRELEREGAIGAYERLIQNGIQRVRTGGTLLAASCSAHVSADEFFAAARGAVLRSKRNSREITTTLHAPDHPATIPEAHYLKAIYFKFEPR